MPAELLIYIVVAAVLIIWLRNVLGTRHGDERDRSAIWDELARRIEEDKNPPKKGEIIDIVDDSEEQRKGELTGVSSSQRILTANDSVSRKFFDLTKEIEGFDPLSFVENSKEAFAMIVESFARGDTSTLKDLLSTGVYNAFAQAIEGRLERGETVQTDIHAVKSAEILDVEVRARIAYVKIRFIANETCIVRNRVGQIISGNPDRSTVMNDVWTFGRDVRSRDPVWYLYETNDDVPENSKTPLPDAR